MAVHLVTTILTGGREAELFLATDGGLVPEAVTTHVRGSGTVPVNGVPDLPAPEVRHEGTTTCMEAGVALTLLRVPGVDTGKLSLTGTWPGQDTPLLLATMDGLTDRGSHA
jgi:hypothetical protein